jgi:hypothetical protein
MGDRTTELPEKVCAKIPQQLEDLELIHRSQAGDTEAFGELVTKYRTKIFSMIYGIVGNETCGSIPRYALQPRVQRDQKERRIRLARFWQACEAEEEGAFGL